MIITFPSLESTLYQKTGSKFIIRQLLASKQSIPLNKLQENRFYLVVENNGNKICITTKEEYIPEEFEFTLFTNVLPCKQRFEEGEIVTKGWAKHPLLKEYSSSEIIESWKNDFLYKEEDKNESGLRQPQIAALHMIMGHLKLQGDFKDRLILFAAWKGDRNDLMKLLEILKNEIPEEYEILIVQPGLSKARASDDILTLLGVTATYIKEFQILILK